MSTTITLTQDQQQVLAVIYRWYKDFGDQFFVLSGYAGTGKTTTLHYLVEKLLEEDKSVVVSAPTNQAVRVLKERVPNATAHHTIHKLLNIKASQYGTREVFKQDFRGQVTINDYDLVIIDEASMISCNGDSRYDIPSLLDILQDELHNSTKVLFVGDPAQLPPVNEATSKVFGYPGVRLTKIVRHSDVIAKKAELLRETSQRVALETLLEPPLISQTSKSAIPPVFSNFQADPLKNRILCYTNKAVKRWNRDLRHHELGTTPTEFIPGERIIAQSPCMWKDKNETTNYGQVVMLGTSQEATITEVQEKEKHLYLRAKTDEDKSITLRFLKKEYLSWNKSYLKEKASEKDWPSYWQRVYYYHDLRHCYSMTVHKSQGSTIENVYIDWKDLQLNRDPFEKNQLLYVALTRASHTVNIIH